MTERLVTNTDSVRNVAPAKKTESCFIFRARGSWYSASVSTSSDFDIVLVIGPCCGCKCVGLVVASPGVEECGSRCAPDWTGVMSAGVCASCVVDSPLKDLIRLEMMPMLPVGLCRVDEVSGLLSIAGDCCTRWLFSSGHQLSALHNFNFDRPSLFLILL